MDIEGQQFAPVRHVIEAVPLHERRRADPLVRPVVHPAGDELVRNHLPEELSRRGIEGEEDSLVAHDFLVVESLVVGADEDPASRHHRVPVGLRTERRHPTHVVAAVHVPFGGEPGGAVGDHVPVRSSTPHRPVLGACADGGQEEQKESRRDDLPPFPALHR
jgi:hypothetical protein